MAIVDRGDSAGNACVIAPVNNTGTTMDADGIITGRLSSFDGYTYFDLINNIIKLRKSIDRVIIGDFGSGNYGIKCYDASGNLLMRIDDSEQIIQSADGKTYFNMKNQYFRVHSTTERVRVGKYGSEYGIVVWDGSSNILLQITDTVQKIQSADGKTYFDLNDATIRLNHPTAGIYTYLAPAQMYRTYNSGTHKHDIAPTLKLDFTANASGGHSQAWMPSDPLGLGSVGNYGKLVLITLFYYKQVGGALWDTYVTMVGSEVQFGTTANLFIPNGTFPNNQTNCRAIFQGINNFF